MRYSVRGAAQRGGLMLHCSHTTLAIIGTLARLAQVQEPGGSCGEAAGGGGLEPMTKRPVRRYTVDGKLMTPDDLRRLHDYLADLDTIAIISDEMRVVDRERMARVHPQAATETMIPRGTYFGRPVGERSRTTKASITSVSGLRRLDRLPRSSPSVRARRAVAAPGAGSTAMTGAQFEIRIDGTRRSYRDRKDYAMEAARFLKSKNLHSMVEVKDLQSGELPRWLTGRGE